MAGGAIGRNKSMEYTVVIRTLGKAGDKYQQELNSILAQTIQPKEILVYIAEGYSLPKETCGLERYIFVKKGMVAQRAIQYDEVTTEYILFLDDDVYLPPNGVETLYEELKKHDAQVISPDVFDNSSRGLKSELLMTISGRMRARRGDKKWAYKVMNTGGYSYNKNPRPGSCLSMTNAGPCFFCRKEDFLKIQFEEELWMDSQAYAIGDDQVMFYKMYLCGLKQLTVFGSGIVHLDAGSAKTGNSEEREKRLLYADLRYKVIFWHRFLWTPEKNILKRIWSASCLGYMLAFTHGISLIKGEWSMYKLKRGALKSALAFIKSKEYKKFQK